MQTFYIKKISSKPFYIFACKSFTVLIITCDPILWMIMTKLILEARISIFFYHIIFLFSFYINMEVLLLIKIRHLKLFV